MRRVKRVQRSPLPLVRIANRAQKTTSTIRVTTSQSFKRRSHQKSVNGSSCVCRDNSLRIVGQAPPTTVHPTDTILSVTWEVKTTSSGPILPSRT